MKFERSTDAHGICRVSNGEFYLDMNTSIYDDAYEVEKMLQWAKSEIARASEVVRVQKLLEDPQFNDIPDRIKRLVGTEEGITSARELAAKQRAFITMSDEDQAKEIAMLNKIVDTLCEESDIPVDENKSH